MHKSETSKVRDLLSKWCEGYGIDIGTAGDKITKHAIAIDYPVPYALCGSDPIQLGGDARDLFWFKDEVLDFVYSSHVLEDFEDTIPILNEWTRVLKRDGYLILFLPDEQKYRAHCKKAQTIRNPAHKHDNFCAQYVKDCIRQLEYFLTPIFESEIIHDYSFALVYQKIG